MGKYDVLDNGWHWWNRILTGVVISDGRKFFCNSRSEEDSLGILLFTLDLVGAVDRHDDNVAASDLWSAANDEDDGL